MDSGNTAWILICIALVLLMTPGLAFFYCGLVREKQVINTIKMSFVALGIIAIEWAIIGYSLAFAEGTPLIGGLAWFGLDGVGRVPYGRGLFEVFEDAPGRAAGLAELGVERQGAGEGLTHERGIADQSQWQRVETDNGIDTRNRRD